MREHLKSTEEDLEHTSNRLRQGIEENEALYSRVKELERQLRTQEKVFVTIVCITCANIIEKIKNQSNLLLKSSECIEK